MASTQATFPEHLVINIHDDIDPHWFKVYVQLTYDDLLAIKDIMQSWLDMTKDDIVLQRMQIDCVELFKKDKKFCYKFYKKLINTLTQINLNDKPRIYTTAKCQKGL